MKPFTPEPAEALKARLPKAIETVMDPHEILAGRQAHTETNLFDFERGYRLIISRDKIAGTNYTHISVSRVGDRPIRRFDLPDIQACVWELGLPYDVMAGWHDWTGIPHWFWDIAGDPPRCLRQTGSQA